MNRVATCLLLLLLLCPFTAYTEEGTYCDDPAEWADRHERATKHAGDLDSQTLHALWIGLGAKIGNGTLTEDEATSLFERVRATLIQQVREKQPQKSTPPAL